MVDSSLYGPVENVPVKSITSVAHISKPLKRIEHYSEQDGLCIPPETAIRLEHCGSINTNYNIGHWILDKEQAKKGKISEPQEVSVLTFDLGLKYYSEAINKYENVGVSMLFGDMGFRLNKIKQFLGDFPFPKTYSEILEKYNVRKEAVSIVSETFLSQSSKFSIERLKDTDGITSITEGPDEILYTSGDLIPVGKLHRDEKGNGKVRSLCPLIQAEELMMLELGNYHRVVFIRNADSFFCNRKWLDLYIKRHNEFRCSNGSSKSPLEVISVTLKYEEVSNKLSVDEVYWVDPESELMKFIK